MQSESDCFVYLRAGLMVPLPAFEVVLEIERRGIKIWLDRGDVLLDGNDVTPDLVDNLRRWKPQVRMLLSHMAGEVHRREAECTPPPMRPVVVTRRPA